mmetsp:Transcript_30940/g.69713  ORF Transcript_30940/g.69713 Transcript_30940/m.69713 type:complete len:211 (+) Transcript_30940:1450-2082(+)
MLESETFGFAVNKLSGLPSIHFIKRQAGLVGVIIERNKLLADFHHRCNCCVVTSIHLRLQSSESALGIRCLVWPEVHDVDSKAPWPSNENVVLWRSTERLHLAKNTIVACSRDVVLQNALQPIKLDQQLGEHAEDCQRCELKLVVVRCLGQADKEIMLIVSVLAVQTSIFSQQCSHARALRLVPHGLLQLRLRLSLRARGWGLTDLAHTA